MVTCLVAPSARADTPEPPALRASTSIAGDRTGYTEVTLGAQLDDQPTITFEGGGDVLGVVLRAAEPPPGRRDWERPELVSLRLTSETDPESVFTGMGDGVGGTSLPAGRYRLYLIAPRHGRVTLTIPSLPAGEATFAPVIQTPFSTAALPPLSSSASTTTVFGQTGQLVSAGIGFGRAIVRHPLLGSRFETCTYYTGEEAAAGAAAYTEGCPGGHSDGGRRTVTSDDLGVYALGWVSSPTDFGFGGNLTAPPLSSTKQPVEGFAMWMSYEFPRASSPGSTGGSGQEQQLPPPYRNDPPPTGSGRNAAGPGSGDTGNRAARGTLTFNVNRLLVRGGRSRFRVVCSEEGPCRGSAALSPGMRRVPLVVAAGRQATVKVLLSRQVARRLARRGRMRSILRVRSATTRGSAEQRATVVLIAIRGHGWANRR